MITIGGWERLEGGKIFAARLHRALRAVRLPGRPLEPRRACPVASALAIILAIFAGIAAPAWFDRAKDGLDSPALPEELLGLLTLLLVPVQVILIAVAMVAFNQDWHVEEERPIGDEIIRGEPDDPDEEPRAHAAAAAPAAARASSRSMRSTAARRPRKA